MYVTDEPKHLAKSLQQGISQTKLLKLPVSHHDECILPMKENNWQKNKKRGEQSAGIWQSKHITDKEKTSQSIRQAKTKANNLTNTFTSKSPLNIGQHKLFSKQIKFFRN